MVFNAHIVTLFPEMFPGPLAHSITGRALAENKWQLRTTNIRDFALPDAHKTVDDTPYGGGAGMVMRPDVVAAAVRHARAQTPNAPVIYLTPTGERLTQPLARELAAAPSLILLCGHYEGIDQRAIDAEVDREISLGDFVLTGGEIAAYPMIDAIVRLQNGVLGAHNSLQEESFDITDTDGTPLLEYPHYTRPAVWEDRIVPDVLTSGHHAKIEEWRQKKARARTKLREKR